MKEIQANKERRTRYAQHLERQEARLQRVAQLLKVKPNEAQEIVELMLEYSVSAGFLKGNVTKLNKRVKAAA